MKNDGTEDINRQDKIEEDLIDWKINGKMDRVLKIKSSSCLPFVMIGLFV